jgi:universal stress protein A
MAYKHILAAIDLTEDSAQVLEKARRVAALTGASVSLVSVVKPLTQVYGGLDVAPIAASGLSFEHEALKQAGVQIRQLASRFGFDPEQTHVFIGSPAHDVRALAGRLGADLIIVGTHGRHGLGLLLGSTASGIIHGVGCDVLAVRMRFDA